MPPRSPPMSLNDIWFGLFIAIIAGYVILDGFDLGVGMLDLFVAHSDQDRRIVLNSIGPIWDGNEVWLVVGGGVLFAAFPIVYAALFSGFYWALMLVLLFLILRTVAIEFRSQRQSPRWRAGWDLTFSVASFALALLFGVALGNIVAGVPLTQQGTITESVPQLLRLFPDLIGVTAIAMLMMHGGLYLAVKTEAPLYDRERRLTPRVAIAFALLGAVVVVLMFSRNYTMVHRYKDTPWLYVFPLIAAVAFGMIWRFRAAGRDVAAFFSSSVMLGFILISAGIGMYPNLLISTTNPAYNMTSANAASQSETLQVMLAVAIIGLPFVLLYTAGVQYLFRGKVELAPDSY
jgi:cytochrome bd ubiquinol oxidase subunit II